MWKGPLEGGITQSLLNKFMCCPYASYIYLILGLEEDEKEDDNLMWGDCFHVGLEHYIKTRDKNDAIHECLKYLDKQYPHAPQTFKYSLENMLFLFKAKDNYQGDWDTEVPIDRQIIVDGEAVRILGKKDGQTFNHPEYGGVLGEHKCKGTIYPDQLRDEIVVDLQCNLYMYITNLDYHEGRNSQLPLTEHVIYDLIQIPDVQKYGPPKHPDESSKDFIQRIFAGPIGSYGGKYPININTHSWFYQNPYEITLEQQAEYWDKTIRPIIKRLCDWYSWVTQTGFDHENPKFYNELFYKMPIRHFDGRKTPKYKCDYYEYLVGNQDLNDLRPVKKYHAELPFLHEEVI